MRDRIQPVRVNSSWRLTQDQAILLLSILVQLTLGLIFGHAYDMRIYMATGYLVGNGQNPYVAQDLTAVFHNSFFKGMTSVGYPPPWPLILGLIYKGTYALSSNLMFYNLTIKLPIIAANICLAYLVADILKNLGADGRAVRRAWVFMLLCPFILYFGSAWGQFDSIVVLLSLLSLVHLDRGRLPSSAVLLAFGMAFKPIALPLFPVALLYLKRKSARHVILYSLWFTASLILFCALPFLLLAWDPTPILRGWNAHFIVGWAMSYLTFLELLKDTYQLPGNWWLLGLVWIPAMGIALYTIRHGIYGFTDLLRKSLGMILVFYLTRTWLSEPNILLILSLALILTSLGELNPLAFHVMWVLPMVFTIFNASPPQLLWLNFPQAMRDLLRWLEIYRSSRLMARTALIIPWQLVGWWTVLACLKRSPSQMDAARPDILVSQS